MTLWRGALAVLLAAALAGCSGALRFEEDPPGHHIVRKGDTLYSIALRYDADWREVARWNAIPPPYTLEIGRKLVVDERFAPTVAAAPTAPGAAPSTAKPAPRGRSAPRPPLKKPAAAPTVKYAWSWPAEGKLVARFRAGVATAKGIDIAGAQGAEVRAAFDGKVVYVGSGLVGYGRVIIVKHDDRYLSAYAHNDRFIVAEGDAVKRGQAIATMGVGPDQRALLHFEIRLDGRAIDPLTLLPPR